ncbi:hypothetical protein QFZ63_000825 [Streptomyces sp. B3I7]|uniref:hypothetical protein n=1 Tax=Streptomyces sp. B3I7 TaxID=3042269 RepID=UPI00278063F9|nr:hypothetical protein [Streptomyces sp. B3I7]MDQ0809111.1 hypothetical protein [Streptomyces sp. B3I7]
MRDKGAGGRDGGRSGVEPALDELYTTPPSGFVARRTELAAAARADGRGEDARTLRAARRPTLAAWAANLLLRAEPEESRRLLGLGRSLREAYRALDATGLKELSARRRSVVAALSGQAARHAEEAGHRLSDAARREVEETLRAVLADPEAADRWAAGRLERGLTPPSDFPSDGALLDGAGASDGGGGRAERPAAPSRPASASPPSEKAPVRDELAERRRARQERLARAREAVRQAEERLSGRRTEEADTGAELERAGERLDAARERVAGAERTLREARAELERTERERRHAEERHRAAADALGDAERAGHRAARELERADREPR